MAADTSRKLTSALEGALAGGGDPATSPLYVFTPFLKLIVLGAAVGVAEVTFGATLWLVVFTIFMVSAMYRLVMRWVTDGSGGSGLSEEEFGGWAVKVNAAITFIEYTLTFLVSVAALVTFIADRFAVLGESVLGIPYRGLVAVVLSIFTGWLVNRGPKVAARTFGPATAGVLLLLWAMVLSTLWRHLTGDPALAGVSVLPGLNLQAFSLSATAPGAGSYLGLTLGGFSRILAVMTGIEVFANLVAAYSGDGEAKAKKAFGSLLIIMGTTGATMLIVGPAIFVMSDPGNAEVSVFTQTMDQLLPLRISQFGTLVAVAVLLSASAASAQGIQNLALGLATRNYIPAVLGRPNAFGVADKPVWIEVAVCCVCFLGFGTSEETYLAIYAAGVFILLTMTGWAASKRLTRQIREEFDVSHAVTLVGTVGAALLTSVATVIIFRERFFEGAWTFFVFVPILYVGFSYFRGQLGPPSPAVERLGEIEEAALAGFGPGQFEPLPRVETLIAVDPAGREWPAMPAPGEGWRGPAMPLDHLLVALDGGSSSERVVTFAEALVGHEGGRLSLLSLSPDTGDHIDDGDPIDTRHAQQSREQHVREISQRLWSEGVKTQAVMRSGPVPQTITAVAAEMGADGIVMSSRPALSDSETGLGSDAAEAVRSARGPVVLVRPSWRADAPSLDLDRIVVALDGSEFAERVLPYARGLAQQLGTELVLLTVPEIPVADRYGALSDLVEGLRSDAEDTAQRYLEAVVATLREEDLSARGIVAGSRPARTILAAAEREAADMILIATHGRGGLERLLMGSIAERVLEDASCPVFMLPILERQWAEAATTASAAASAEGESEGAS